MRYILVCLMLWTGAGLWAQWDKAFTNLKVMPKDATAAQVRAKMFEFTRSLNVRCSHCHVGERSSSGGMDNFDFASDEKPAKAKAREMMSMVDKINGEFLFESETKVSCNTCHKGLTNPESLSVLMQKAYDEKGLAAAMDTYARLHDEHHGRGRYDFGPWPLNRMAASLGRQGKTEEAAFLNRFNLRYHPDFHHARFWTGREAMEAGDRLQARNIFAGLTRKTSRLAEWMNGYAYDLKGKEQTELGLQVLIMLTQLVPTYANGFDSTGEFYAELGNKKKAIEFYTRALQVDPGLVSSQQALERLKAQ